MDQQAAVRATGAWSPRFATVGDAIPILKETIMRKLVLLATAAGLVCATAVAAHADSLGRPCTTASPQQWLPLETLQAKVEAQGYTVQKGKLKSACGEFYVRDKNGGRVELFVDPTNGNIVGKL